MRYRYHQFSVSASGQAVHLACRRYKAAFLNIFNMSSRMRKILIFVLLLVGFFSIGYYIIGTTLKPFEHPGFPFILGNDSVEVVDYNPNQQQLTIHQSWKNKDLPKQFQRWSTSWKKCFPNAKHILWTDASNRRLVAKHYPWFLSRYDRMPAEILRADAVRYLYMFHYGGLYTDLDNECIRPFDHLLRNTSIMFGSMAGGGKNVKEGYVSNAFMYSKARHPFWMDLLHSIMENSDRLPPEKMTGPDVLSRAINAYRTRLKSEKVITVYPPRYFNPFSWKTRSVKACKDFNQMTEFETIECRDAFRKTSYVVQYHTHTWSL